MEAREVNTYWCLNKVGLYFQSKEITGWSSEIIHQFKKKWYNIFTFLRCRK